MPRLYQAAASPLFWHLRLHSFVVQMRRHALEQLVELRSTCRASPTTTATPTWWGAWSRSAWRRCASWTVWRACRSNSNRWPPSPPGPSPLGRGGRKALLHNSVVNGPVSRYPPHDGSPATGEGLQKHQFPDCLSPPLPEKGSRPQAGQGGRGVRAAYPSLTATWRRQARGAATVLLAKVRPLSRSMLWSHRSLAFTQAS